MKFKKAPKVIQAPRKETVEELEARRERYIDQMKGECDLCAAPGGLVGLKEGLSEKWYHEISGALVPCRASGWRDLVSDTYYKEVSN